MGKVPWTTPDCPDPKSHSRLTPLEPTLRLEPPEKSRLSRPPPCHETSEPTGETGVSHGQRGASGTKSYRDRRTDSVLRGTLRLPLLWFSHTSSQEHPGIHPPQTAQNPLSREQTESLVLIRDSDVPDPTQRNE